MLRRAALHRQNGCNQAFNHARNVVGAGLCGFLGWRFCFVAGSALTAIFSVLFIIAVLMIPRRAIDDPLQAPFRIHNGIDIVLKKSLGEIEDIVIENGHTITGVVISVGGFLGVGESYVAVDPSTVVRNEKDGTWRAFIDTSKDNLKNAPKFKYTKNRKS